ncbi:MAG: FAD:protein FMN transferase [Candidatus Cloacimonetes bacterium]|nr:FAD:protein FMN transferase [Candidatus Cloacimonadota bacterium]
MDKSRRGYLIQILFVIILIVIGIWSQKNRLYESNQTAFIMDTFFEIEASGRLPDLESVVDSAFALATEYEKEFSYYDESSILNSLNGLQGGSAPAGRDVLSILETGEYFYKATGGRYDLSIGRLSDLWDIDRGEVPDERAIAEALENTGFDKIIVTGNQVTVPAGEKLNFGSIAKGYIVDRVVDYLKNKGVSALLVNAGGDIRVWGTGETCIGIQHPLLSHGEVIDKIIIADKAVVTSGDYERYFEKDSIRYHHIIDAVTGYPARECVSVTAIADDAETADALSTAAFLMPVEAALKLADDLKGSWVIIYHQDEAGNLLRSLSSGAEKFLE